MVVRKSSRRTLGDQLRDAIADSGLSAYELAKRSEVNRSTISRFIAGETGLSLDAADALAEVLGLRFAETAGRLRSRSRARTGGAVQGANHARSIGSPVITDCEGLSQDENETAREGG
jgi:transcriptional regulator with XRE-family HTH domain